MRRHTFTIVSTLSVLACVGVFVLWNRSLAVHESVETTLGSYLLRAATGKEGVRISTYGKWPTWEPVKTKSWPPARDEDGYQAFSSSTFRESSFLGAGLRRGRVDLVADRFKAPLWAQPGTNADWNNKIISTGHPYLSLAVPYWMMALAFMITPLVQIAVVQRRRPKDFGKCPSCGYDLRATPDRCPECGAMAAAE